MSGPICFSTNKLKIFEKPNIWSIAMPGIFTVGNFCYTKY